MTTYARQAIKVVKATPRKEGPAVVYRALPSSEIGFIDPFLALGEFAMPVEKSGFGFHPHRGVEFITYQLDGQLRHRDPAGTELTIAAGEAIHLMAGKFMEHSEMPVGKEQSHGMQLWVDLPIKDKSAPHTYKRAGIQDIPEQTTNGAIVRTIASETGPLTLHIPSVYLDITLKGSISFSYPLPENWNAFVQLLSGSGKFGSTGVPGEQHDLVLLGKGATVDVVSFSPLRFLLLAALPNNEGGRGMFG